MTSAWYDRDELMPALERSIEWTDRDYARNFFPIEGVTHHRALDSLLRFRELLLEAHDARSFERAVQREYQVYTSAGWDGKGGGVLFTGYCTPILDGSSVATAEFAYPLYALPDDLVKNSDGSIQGRRTADGIEPYPARSVIEANSTLAGRGLELVWLRDPIDAFIAHVNGSAFVRLPDGQMARFGYAGTNGREYTSLGRELVSAGRLQRGTVNLKTIRGWARQHPDEVDDFLNRNERFVFFTPITGNPRGSLNVEVTGGRTLATDKSLFPRGALVYVDTHLPGAEYTDGEEYHRVMLDQDTGGAIRTAGRADIYLGVGDHAEELAGTTRVEGQLYYLFLRDDR
ncbi:MAG: MltA domain-containing protein [Planctomycetes bacterium]|nr:MltA domain-containing protein [Planctomycetota bacterium]